MEIVRKKVKVSSKGQEMYKVILQVDNQKQNIVILKYYIIFFQKSIQIRELRVRELIDRKVDVVVIM